MFTVKDWNTFDEWYEKYGPTINPDGFAKWFIMMNRIEMTGLLVRRGFVELELVDDIMSSGVLITWDKYEPIVRGLREKFGIPQLLEHQEYLVARIGEVVKQQHPDFRGKIS